MMPASVAGRLPEMPPPATTENILVQVGEVRVSRSPGAVLVGLGLGSCIALCAWDPVIRAGGMVHVLLPGNPLGSAADARYAEGGVATLLDEMVRVGARTGRLVLKMAGGAAVLPGFGAAARAPTARLAGGHGTTDDGSLAGVSFGHTPGIGERNALAVASALDARRLRLVAQDVGGRRGRTVRFHVATGDVWVRMLMQDESRL